jgi:hypothetical protein
MRARPRSSDLCPRRSAGQGFLVATRALGRGLPDKALVSCQPGGRLLTAPRRAVVFSTVHGTRIAGGARRGHRPGPFQLAHP